MLLFITTQLLKLYSEMECHLRNVILLLVTLMLTGYCGAQTRNDSIRLKEDVLRGYNRQHRPILNYSQPVLVNVIFHLSSVQSLDEVNGLISVVLIVSMTWYDEIIVWNPALYGGLNSQLFDVEDVWYPRLVLRSSTKGFQELGEDWMRLRIKASGYAYLYSGVLMKSSCDVDVTYYPFDIQNCYLSFANWIETSKEVKLRAPVPYPTRLFYTKHGQWKLVGNYTYVNRNTLSVHLQLKRKPLYAVVNIIIPIILMSVLNLLVFVLPADCGERVSYITTVLLAIAVFLTVVADSLPKTSEPMSVLAFFLMSNLLISCLICISTILNLRTFHNPDELQIPIWQQRMANIVGRATCSLQKQDDHTDGTVNTQYSDNHPDIDDTKVSKYEIRQSSANERHVSWRDVATAFDRLLMTFFSIACAVNTVSFIVVITNG